MLNLFLLIQLVSHPKPFLSAKNVINIDYKCTFYGVGSYREGIQNFPFNGICPLKINVPLPFPFSGRLNSDSGLGLPPRPPSRFLKKFYDIFLRLLRYKQEIELGF